jgi:hypothetical protein
MTSLDWKSCFMMMHGFCSKEKTTTNTLAYLYLNLNYHF